MGISEVTHGCAPDPAHSGLKLPKLANAGSKLALLAAILFLFCNVNMALGASFVLQDGKRVDGEIIYASASSVIIRETNGATAQLGRHTIERVKLATDNNAVLEGVLKSWKNGVYEISNGSDVFEVKARKIISKRQVSAQDVAVTTTEEKQQDSVAVVTEEKDKEIATAATEEEQQEVVAATTVENEQEVAASTTEEQQQEIIIASVEEKENAEQLTFKLGLSKPAKQKVLLIYSTEDGTAQAGSDYEAKRGSVVLQPGSRNATVSVTLLDDELAEGDETFGLLVTSDLNLATVQVNRGAATILDNEAQ